MDEKRVFRNFKYRECDDFAAFLSKMSSEGWHFKEWNFGLIFEKGEPEEVNYSVEIFVKGSELDLKATKDTEEFAEYCKEAGWEFIDSSRKFVVFKKVKEDADEIMTQKERFEYITKAEIKASGTAFISSFLLACWYLTQFIFEGFYYSIFSCGAFIANAVFCISAIYSLICLLNNVRWYKNNKKKLLRGEEIVFGSGEDKQRKKVIRERGVVILILTVLIMTMAFASNMGMAMIVAAFSGLFFICICIIESLRPNKVTYVGSVLAVSIMVPVLFGVFILMNPVGDNIYADKTKAPLLQEDYREVDAPFMQVQIDESENIFGSIRSYYVTYYEYNENPDNEIWDDINYTVIESKQDWIIDYSWKLLTKEMINPKDIAQEWDAVAGYKEYDWNHTFYLKYENEIFMLEYEPDLTQEQITIIRDKLNLGQVM